jgi:hypothetical protein
MTIVEATSPTTAAVVIEPSCAAIAPAMQLSALLADKLPPTDNKSDETKSKVIVHGVDNDDDDDDDDDDEDDVVCDENYDVGPVLPTIVHESFWFVRDQVAAVWQLCEPVDDQNDDDDDHDDDTGARSPCHAAACASKRTSQRRLAMVLGVLALCSTALCVRSDIMAREQEMRAAMFPELPGFDGCDVAHDWCLAARAEHLLQQKIASVQRSDAPWDANKMTGVVRSLLQAWHKLHGQPTTSDEATGADSTLSADEAFNQLSLMVEQINAHVDPSVADAAAATPVDVSDLEELAVVMNEDISVMPLIKCVIKQLLRICVEIATMFHDAWTEVISDADL